MVVMNFLGDLGVHGSRNSTRRVGLLPMNKGCEARVWRPARQPVWRPALLSEVLFSLDVTCDASHDAPHEQGRKAAADSSTAVLMNRPEVQMQILRLTTPKLHPSDEDLSPGTPELRYVWGPFRSG